MVTLRAESSSLMSSWMPVMVIIPNTVMVAPPSTG